MHRLGYMIAGRFSAYLESDGLHPKHRIIKYHQWFAGHLKEHWRILDIGCGNGALAFDMKDRCKSVCAIDINASNVMAASGRFASSKITYLCGDAVSYEFKEKFDAVILSNVLEHIEHRVEFLRKITRLSDRLLLRVPMITRDWISVYAQEFGAEYRLDSSHFIEYADETLVEELGQGGWKILEKSVQFGETWAVCIISDEEGLSL